MSPDSRSVVLLFPNPPIPLVVSPVCVALYRCVSPVGSSVERGFSGWSRVRSAAGSVARVCRLTPLCSRTTLCLLSLLHHRGRWVSLTYHEASASGTLTIVASWSLSSLTAGLLPPSEDSTNIVVSGNGWTFSIAAGVLVAGSSYAIHVHAIDTTGFSSWHAGDASLMVQVHASLLASRACSPGV